MARCPECDADASEDANFCPECGASMRDERRAEGERRTAATAGSETLKQTGLAGGTPDSTPRTEATAGPAGRDRNRDESTPLEGRFWIDALIGGTVGFALATMLIEILFPMYFLGIGGGGLLSGWLHGRGTGQGAAVGGVAGILATVPFATLLVVVVAGFGGFLVADPAAVGFARADELLAAVGVLAVFVTAVVFVVNAVFGVVGGLVGGTLVEG